jgi:hypothetical protein
MKKKFEYLKFLFCKSDVKSRMFINDFSLDYSGLNSYNNSVNIAGLGISYVEFYTHFKNQPLELEK